MSWQEEYEERQKKICDELNVLLIHYTTDELQSRFFKNFGCINFKSNEEQHELELAREFHRKHKLIRPELHDETETTPYNCYHETRCTCGFCEAYDSSD